MIRIGIFALVAVDLGLIALYMRARIHDDKREVRLYQPAAVLVSWLIAATSLLRPDPDVALALVVLVGMGIAILGDFLNIDMEDMRVVMRGLVIAVAAYMTYAIGLTVLNGFHGPDLIVAVPLLTIHAGLMRALWFRMEPSMRIPSLIYALVLPFTFSRAVSTFFGTRFELQQSIFLSLGTFSLFVGDVEFAIHTFKRRLSFMLGPILYAGGQLLIALSTWA